MPVENQGSQQIEENIQKSFNPKSQDQINNERYIAQQEEAKKIKDGLNEAENEWAEKEKEHDRQVNETLNQRKFFTQLHQNLKDGKISPKDTIEFEELEEKSAEEISSLDEHTFNVWVERNMFARELYETRKAQESKIVANAIADDIELDRKKDWAKRVELMTKEEREKFDRRFIENVDKLEE